MRIASNDLRWKTAMGPALQRMRQEFQALGRKEKELTQQIIDLATDKQPMTESKQRKLEELSATLKATLSAMDKLIKDADEGWGSL